MDATPIYWAIALLLSVLGLAGLLVPMLPGAPLLFFGLLLAAWAENFTHVGPATLTVLGIMALLTYAVDFFASIFGAKRFGASSRALWGAGLGAMAGIFLGIVGIFLGPFLGAVLGELSARRNLCQAGWAGIGTTLGTLLGSVAKFALGCAMIGLFIVVRLWKP